MSRDLTFSKVFEEPLLFYPRKKTTTKMISFEDRKILGIKLVGPVYKLHLKDGNYFPNSKPFMKFYNYIIWDPFASDVLDYEMEELKKSEGIDLAMLIGDVGYIKIYEKRAITQAEYKRVLADVSTANGDSDENPDSGTATRMVVTPSERSSEGLRAKDSSGRDSFSPKKIDEVK